MWSITSVKRNLKSGNKRHTKYQAPKSKNPIPNTWNLESRAKNENLNFKHQIPSSQTKYQESRTKIQESRIKYQIPSNKFQNPGYVSREAWILRCDSWQVLREISTNVISTFQIQVSISKYQAPKPNTQYPIPKVTIYNLKISIRSV